ncbi:alkaline phosphatase family protein [Oenococcus oeni]|uniref:alkaline phosphatase family protein n=1 Tax=Oenococcus oeni TaxID=1247 RepID=UPI0010B04531|nr:ectonucleotide pyrophosphatase/phosphodiesterase [Oenococcus oeni]SYW08055.1 putative Alkaline phosphodiesterase I [Oenococcus oeni]
MFKDKKHLLVVSFDAFGALDAKNHLDIMPNLKSLIEQGTHVKKIFGIYPTLTYPSHTTIVTGDYPKNHAIVNNTLTQIERGSAPDWYWWSKYVKAPTLYQLAYEQRMDVAAFLWPVTAGSPAIKYNIAEIFPNRIWQNQYTQSFKASSPFFTIHMNSKFAKLRNGIAQPQLDDFVTASVCWTLEHKYPDLTLVHLVDLDSMRHHYGVESKEAIEALERLDTHLGMMLDSLKKINRLQETNIAVLGDHYQIDVSRMIHLNYLFKQNSWLDYDEAKQVITNWRVMAKTTDGSTYIYLKDPKMATGISRLIKEHAGQGIEKVYSKKELIELGADPKADLMVEAKVGYYFTDEISVTSLIEEVDVNSIGQTDRYHAVHGFLPTRKNYQTTLILSGPGIKATKKIRSARLIDEAPTFARILGLKFTNSIDGEEIKDAFID